MGRQDRALAVAHVQHLGGFDGREETRLGADSDHQVHGFPDLVAQGVHVRQQGAPEQLRCLRGDSTGRGQGRPRNIAAGFVLCREITVGEHRQQAVRRRTTDSEFLGGFAHPNTAAVAKDLDQPQGVVDRGKRVWGSVPHSRKAKPVLGQSGSVNFRGGHGRPDQQIPRRMESRPWTCTARSP